VPVASSKRTFGYFLYSCPFAPFEKFPNEQPKIILYPSRTSPATTWGICAFEAMLSLYVVCTFEPSIFWTYRRPASCACDQPWSLCGPG